jgi:cell division inhibitor SulA
VTGSVRGPLLLCAALLTALLLPAPILAQAPIGLQVQVIYAANQPGGVDERLGPLVKELQKTFRYSMYQLLDTPKGTAALQQAWKTALPGDRTLEIVPTGAQGGQHTLTVRILGAGGQQQMNTQVRLKSGASPVVLGGLTYQQGVLILAISIS